MDKITNISEIANMIATCDCDWKGYASDCYLINDIVTCPECGSEVILSLDDFSPWGEDW